MTRIIINPYRIYVFGPAVDREWLQRFPDSERYTHITTEFMNSEKFNGCTITLISADMYPDLVIFNAFIESPDESLPRLMAIRVYKNGPIDRFATAIYPRLS